MTRTRRRMRWPTTIAVIRPRAWATRLWVRVGLSLILPLVICTYGHSQMPGGGGGGSAKPRQAAARPKQAPYYEPNTNVLVADVIFSGNQAVANARLRELVKTRPARQFDPALLQADVRALMTSGLFQDVRTSTAESPHGVVVTYHVVERPTLRHVHFFGNEDIKYKALLRESGLKVGDPINRYAIEEGRRKIEEYYRGRGYADAQISIMDDPKEGNQGVVYRVHEGPKQRYRKTDFVGNTFVSDQRLKAAAQIESKPGILWVFGGKVDERKIEADIERLESYYRSFGFFRANISHELRYDSSEKWPTLTFIVAEGPQYFVRDVKIVGNQKFSTDELQSQLILKSQEPYNLGKLRRDENSIRDTYGSQGYIMAKITTSPRFLPEPGQIDLVYEIEEGEQWRVGRILVNIDGEYAQTKRSVVWNRLSIRPNDIVDIREVRASERRLKSSQLFVTDPSVGEPPRIVVKPRETDEDEDDGGSSLARQPSGTVRGQSPVARHEVRYPRLPHRVADLIISARPTADRGSHLQP